MLVPCLIHDVDMYTLLWAHHYGIDSFYFVEEFLLIKKFTVSAETNGINQGRQSCVVFFTGAAICGDQQLSYVEIAVSNVLHQG